MSSDSLPEPSAGAAAAPSAGTIPAANSPAATKDSSGTGSAETGSAETGGPIATDAAPATASPALPLADYDNLSLASIRARLRMLTTDQLKVLANYERQNAERPDVLGMLERRIEKVENGG
jgi:hypothetical protein